MCGLELRVLRPKECEALRGNVLEKLRLPFGLFKGAAGLSAKGAPTKWVCLPSLPPSGCPTWRRRPWAQSTYFFFWKRKLGKLVPPTVGRGKWSSCWSQQLPVLCELACFLCLSLLKSFTILPLFTQSVETVGGAPLTTLRVKLQVCGDY